MTLSIDEAHAALRGIFRDMFNAMRLFYAFEAPEGFTVELTGGRKLEVGKEGLILLREADGTLKVVPLDAAVILTTTALAVQAAKAMYPVQRREGDPNG